MYRARAAGRWAARAPASGAMASWQGDVVYGVCVWRALSLCSAGLLAVAVVRLSLAGPRPGDCRPSQKKD